MNTTITPKTITMYELLSANNHDLSNHDLATLADWAGEQVRDTPNPDWKRAYALIREGADLLLRRRARSSVTLTGKADNNPAVPVPVDYLELRKQINDWISIFYGPHICSRCNLTTIIKQAVEQGGGEYEEIGGGIYRAHVCKGQITG